MSLYIVEQTSTLLVEMQEFYTPEEAAKICRVTRATVYIWIKDGRLSAYKLPRGKCWRITTGALESFVAPPMGRPRLVPVDLQEEKGVSRK